jgi:hypothetical protein
LIVCNKLNDFFEILKKIMREKKNISFQKQRCLCTGRCEGSLDQQANMRLR